jgi:predicted Zn-dependent peptidase
MALQWTSLSITPERLESARRKVAAEEEAGITASVLRQLMRELEPRIWSDLDYRFRGYGGAAALQSVDGERLRAYYERMIRPADWKLYVSGQVEIANLRAVLQETVATIKPAAIADQPESPEGQAPQLGVRLQLPAQLSQRHAVAAYRLPAAAELDSAALLLLARYLNNSPAVEALRNELGANAQVNVGFDLRRQAGLVYLYASWDERPEFGDVAARLAVFAEEAATAEIDSTRLERTRKALMIDYWTRRQATQPYALWRAGRLAVGLTGDDLPEKLVGLTEDQLKSTAANLLRRDNRVNLVTVPR